MGNRPITSETRKLNEIKDIINNEIKAVMFEVFDEPKETEYKIIYTRFDNSPMTICRFRTNSGTSYDLEFIYTYIDADKIKLNNNELLSKYYRDNYSMDIGFTLTNRNKENSDEYIKRSKLNEQYEVFNRISYIMKEYIKNKKNDKCFVIGKNTFSSNLNVYIRLYNDIFSNDFKMFEGNSWYYGPVGAYYFVSTELITTELK